MTLAKSTQSTQATETNSDQFSLKLAITGVTQWKQALQLWYGKAKGEIPSAVSTRAKAIWDISDDAETSDLSLRLACVVFLLGWAVQIIIWLAPLLIWFSQAAAFGLVAIAIG